MFVVKLKKLLKKFKILTKGARTAFKKAEGRWKRFNGECITAATAVVVEDAVTAAAFDGTDNEENSFGVENI